MSKSPNGPLRVGIGGPVGSGKTALMEALCKAFRDRYDICAITNDIYTKEDALILVRAGALQMAHFGRSDIHVDKKGAIDLVTEADIAVERMFRDLIAGRFPDHQVLAEELGDRPVAPTGPCWVFDPIDGTTNFAHGLPWFAVSIALEEGGVLQCGVIAVPPLGEFFVGERGRGAYLIAGNGEPVRLAVSTVRELGRALIATGLPPEPGRSPHITTIPKVMRKALEVRIMGSAAAHLACVAAGRLEAFWEPNLNPWDVAAGILLVEEAGGRVSDLSGRPLRAPGGDVLATNGAVHVPLLELIRGQEPA